MIIIFRFFVVLSCILVLSDYANALCDYVPNPLVTESGTWTVDEYCFDTDSEAESYCRSVSHYRFVGPEVFEGHTNYYVYVNPVGSFHLLYCWVDPDNADTDGDGIPDSQDPCPNNPDPNCDPNDDSDGDGKKDDEDPCPNNPNPNCTDPNDPPGPTIPGEIVIGDCTVDITSLKAWLLSDDSFPFNFIWRIYTVISPLLDLSPEPPVLEFDFSLDPSSKYSWVPDTVPLKFDFTQFDFLAKLLRYFEIAGLCLAFAFYGMKRYRNFTGAGG